MRVDLRLHHPAGDSKWRMYEVKSTAFCKSHYRTRWHACGRSWADWRAKAAVQERYDQAADLDVNLFKGAQPPPMASAIGRFEGGVRALVCGGCCELNTSADHGGADIILRRIRLPVHRGGMGIRSVAATSTPAFMCGHQAQ